MTRLFALAVTAATIAIWFLINALSSYYVERAIFKDAAEKAMHWGSYMSERVPELEQLVATGVPSQEQVKVIRQIRSLGDVFRFKLFDSEGRLVIISDENSITHPAGVSTKHDPEPQIVADTHETIIAVHDGTQKEGRPDLYAEAYLPLLGGQGETTGIIEVYVDVSGTQTFYKDSFQKFGLIVSAVCALLFLLPTAGFAVQYRMAHRSMGEVEYLSRYDPLTGLTNRAEFLRRAERLYAEGKLSSLLFIDADKFKSINDTHGHAVGDGVSVATRPHINVADRSKRHRCTVWWR
ncbi:diguanylate cyclase domain-containing protein [Pseudophaeobacter leonis]|uniref:diguanylate cyclase domain-containing protein n=1 Tax=Pseudophaeobacter leonis TaxID=1144477 RepID=UPI00111C6C80|nr:diguanylate cyclase [Pseudophaeobacter leonis]